MADPPEIPPHLLDIDVGELRARNFTGSGARQFQKTVEEYGDRLYRRAIQYGRADAAPDMDPDVTHEHIRSAAHSIASSFGRPESPKWTIWAKIGEYLGTGAAGVGAGNISDGWGIITFVLGMSLAVVLLAVRLTYGGAE